MAVQNGQLLLGALLLCLGSTYGQKITCTPPAPGAKKVYEFSAVDILEKENISFTRYTGKVLAVMNVATFWGLNRAHNLGMNALKEEFPTGFEVLGFPCNEFAMLEPESNGTEILNALKYVRPGNGFIPNFQMFKMVDVNGQNEIPLYTYLKERCGPTSDEFHDMLFYSPLRVNDVRWNYEVFLINKAGYPVYRFHHKAPMEDIADAVRHLMQMPIVESTYSNEIPLLEPGPAVFVNHFEKKSVE